LTGISEILVLVLLIACILILPRLFKGEPDKKISSSKKIKNLSAKLRFNVVLTLAWPMIMALYLKPWEDHLILFISYGVAPVILVWAIIWIMAGKKKRQ
jgi:Na+/H+ antiporter NhaD/arsenite permease-like protein